MSLGLSDRLARASIVSPLTVLFLVASLVMGLVALAVIPREEEPQISVPMVEVFVAADGLKAPDAVELVTRPLETLLKGIPGVEHVYSQTADDRATVTVRFEVGTPQDDAVLRVHAKIRANYDRIPTGIPEPLIVGRGIDDVAVSVLTLSPSPAAAELWQDGALLQLAGKLQAELMKIDDIGTTAITGAGPMTIRIEPDPERLALAGVTLQELIGRLRGANRSFLAGTLRQDGRMVSIAAGQTLAGIPDIGLLLIKTRDGRPVYVRDLARISVGPAPAEARVWNMRRADGWKPVPAVSLSLAKRAGANAVIVTEAIRARVAALKDGLIPADIQVDVTRDYGRTASEKADELLFHLGLATLSIVALIAVAIGWREAVVTLVVIPTTILLTMLAAHLMGYTINRVSLFALIFSIGILVDDAIVVVENIARHWGLRDGRPRLQAAVEAVAEVGNPTIVATLTVIAALLPMLFVSGLMGPYMAPIPANASAAMLFSFLVAMTVAPWLMLKLAPRGAAAGHAADEGRLGRLYRRVVAPVLRSRSRAWALLLGAGGLTLLSCLLFYGGQVTVKLLPFDNKSELSVVIDLPAGATLEDTDRTLSAAAAIAQALPEAETIQAYVGTAAPFNFNGLVRHSYLRQSPELGELQINLAGKGERRRSSHEIALALREALKSLALPAGAALKVVEVPPGPPVLSTLLAEIYGPDPETRRAVAREVEGIFRQVPFIVDVDTSFRAPAPRLRLSIDQEAMEHLGVEQGDVYDTVAALLGSVPIGYSHRGPGRDPLPITLSLLKPDRSWSERLAATLVPANTLPGSTAVFQLGQLVKAEAEPGSPTIFRRDGRFADMVTAELAGRFEAPLYGMLEVGRRIDAHDWGDLPKPVIRYRGQPEDESHPALLWDGEWEITWVTFRDMGAAFLVALLGIAILVVAQFKSFRLPLVILIPVPLTLIGILPGHWLLGAPFTATSMIGFIALAGIIVRNSILLVDFIRHAPPEKSLREIVTDAGAIRFKPILLTALSAMIGAATILTDPIFQGLAISLLFGLAASTLLTLLVIPAVYVALRR